MRRVWLRVRLRLQPRGSDRGAISTFVAIIAAALVILVGIVLDFGGRLRAIEQTDALAQEAARVAGQQLDEKALRDGDGYQVRREVAADAVAAYLASKGLRGHVDFPAPDTVAVNIETTYPTTLLGVVGVTHLPVRGYGRATLVHGVTKAENG